MCRGNLSLVLSELAGIERSMVLTGFRDEDTGGVNSNEKRRPGSIYLIRAVLVLLAAVGGAFAAAIG
jgi:hypothetical protein